MNITYKLTVVDTTEGKRLIKKIQQSKAVAVFKKSATKQRLKSKSLTSIVAKEDAILGKLMDKVKTGKTVSKSTVMKLLNSR